MSVTRRSFFAQLAGGLSLLAARKLPGPRVNPAWLTATHRVHFAGEFGQYNYVIRRAWKPVHNVAIPIIYKRCGLPGLRVASADGVWRDELYKPPQFVEGDLKWYDAAGNRVS